MDTKELEKIANTVPNLATLRIYLHLINLPKYDGGVYTTKFAMYDELQLSKRKVNIFYNSMKKIFGFIDFTEKDIEKASEMQWIDFEDSIQYASAEKVNSDYIITRNIKDFETKEIQAITPEEFILKFET